MVNTQPSLPPYPSSYARNSLTASQLAQLNQAIASAVIQTLALPQAELNTPATHKFVSTYAQDTAFRVLQSLIWGDVDPRSNGDDDISKRVLLLAEKLASSGPGMDIQTLLDLAIIYAPRYHSRAQALFSSVFNTTPSLARVIESEIAPAFTTLLSQSHSSGLYELRKAAQCISCFLHAAPPRVVRVFVHHKDFISALANAYDERLSAIARSYGGLRVQQAADRGAIDEWERVWVETKVALMDAFHVLVSQVLEDLSVASDTAFATESERFFDLLFGLLDLPSPSASSHPDTARPPPTPFLDRSILADYQYAYDLTQGLASAFGRSKEKDARIDILETSFQSFDSEINGGGNKKDAGALKLLLKPSHIPDQAEKNGPARIDKGKGRDTSIDHPTSLPPESTPDQFDLDLKVSQVLDILPDYSPTYIRALLAHPAYPFCGSVEKVVEALLEGKAPAQNEIEGQQPTAIKEVAREDREEFVYTRDRKNIFDSEIMDVSRVHFGKKRQDEGTVLRDRQFIEEMKADILRRAEAMLDDEDESEVEIGGGSVVKEKAIDIAHEDELGLDVFTGLNVIGDGDESEQEGGDEILHRPETPTSFEADGKTPRRVSDETVQRPSPEAILELAYIRDPKLFERDGQTRRGKPRADLKAQTGWSDEQIEGWRIMLERNPRKDKILQKHEFSGNKPWAEIDNVGEAGTSSGAERGKSGRGGGRGGGGRGRGGGDRSWKEKNKASRGNHNRKRGHDKKMARGGGLPA